MHCLCRVCVCSYFQNSSMFLLRIMRLISEKIDRQCRYFNVVFYTLFVHKQLCDYYFSYLILGETYLAKGIQKFSIIQQTIQAPWALKDFWAMTFSPGWVHIVYLNVLECDSLAQGQRVNRCSVSFHTGVTLNKEWVNGR